MPLIKRKPGPGRPKSPNPRVTMTVSMDQWAIDWINENLPRSVSVSAFARDCMQKEIAMRMSQAGTLPVLRDPKTGRIRCISELTPEELQVQLEHAFRNPTTPPQMPPGYYRDAKVPPGR